MIPGNRIDQEIIPVSSNGQIGEESELLPRFSTPYGQDTLSEPVVKENIKRKKKLAAKE